MLQPFLETPPPREVRTEHVRHVRRESMVRTPPPRPLVGIREISNKETRAIWWRGRSGL